MIKLNMMIASISIEDSCPCFVINFVKPKILAYLPDSLCLLSHIFLILYYIT